MSVLRHNTSSVFFFFLLFVCVQVVDPGRMEELNQFVMLDEEMDAEEGSSSGEGDKPGNQLEDGSSSSEEDDCPQDSQEVDQDFRDSLKTALGPAALDMDSVSWTTCHCTALTYVHLLLPAGGVP